MLLNFSTNQLYSYLLCKQVEDDIVVEASVKVSQIVLCGREREEEREGREEGERKGRKKGERGRKRRNKGSDICSSKYNIISSL